MLGSSRKAERVHVPHFVFWFCSGPQWMGGGHQTHPEMMFTQKSGQPWAPWSQHMKPTITEANTFDTTDAALEVEREPGRRSRWTVPTRHSRSHCCCSI